MRNKKQEVEERRKSPPPGEEEEVEGEEVRGEEESLAERKAELVKKMEKKSSRRVNLHKTVSKGRKEEVEEVKGEEVEERREEGGEKVYKGMDNYTTFVEPREKLVKGAGFKALEDALVRLCSLL